MSPERRVSGCMIGLALLSAHCAKPPRQEVPLPSAAALWTAAADEATRVRESLRLDGHTPFSVHRLNRDALAMRLNAGAVPGAAALTMQVPVDIDRLEPVELVPVYDCDGTLGPLWRRGITADGDVVVATPIGPDLQVFVMRRTGRIVRTHAVTVDSDTLHLTYEANTLGLFDRSRPGQCTSSSRPPPLVLEEALQAEVALPEPVAERRLLRVALATTPAFVSIHAGNSPDAAAQRAAAALAEASAIFERDSGISFCVVSFPDAHVAAARGQECADGPDQIEEARDRLRRHSPSHFDIGHVMTCGEGGSANAGACALAIESRSDGQTGFTWWPFSDESFSDFIHELGHQLGALHTFSGTSQRMYWDQEGSVEPGSGSTLMSYATDWDGRDRLQPARDFYFHAASVAQMLAFTRSARCAPPCLTPTRPCGDEVRRLTAPPQVACNGLEFHVPEQQPFLLPSCTDPSAGVDERWEEIDVAAAQGASPPVARSRATMEVPLSIPSRSVVLNPHTASIGDQFPAAGLRLLFRVTARARDGAIAFGDVRVHVTPSVDFRVTTPAGGAEHTIELGHALHVEWTAEAIRAAPYNVARVEIDLSIDDGSTWREYGVFENDGAADVPVNSLVEGTYNLRLRVRGSHHIVYALSDALVLHVRATEEQAAGSR